MKLTEEDIQIIKKKTKGCCAICGSPYNLEIHHLIPRGSIHRGSDNVENLVYLCNSCHTQGPKAVHRDRKALCDLQDAFIADREKCIKKKEINPKKWELKKNKPQK